MKKIVILSLVALFTLGFFGLNVNQADALTRVKGYMTKRGTYVMPHYKSTRDSYKFNNYSSKGNYNPFTGKKGYKNW